MKDVTIVAERRRICNMTAAMKTRLLYRVRETCEIDTSYLDMMNKNIMRVLEVLASALSYSTVAYYRQLLVARLVKHRDEMFDEKGMTKAKLQAKLLDILRGFVWQGET